MVEVQLSHQEQHKLMEVMKKPGVAQLGMLIELNVKNIVTYQDAIRTGRWFFSVEPEVYMPTSAPGFQ